MRTYYKHTDIEDIYYRTQPHTTQLQVRYGHSDYWQASLRYKNSSDHMEPLIKISKDEVPSLPVAKIHKTFKTLYCTLLTLVVTLVVVVSTNPIN